MLLFSVFELKVLSSLKVDSLCDFKLQFEVVNCVFVHSKFSLEEVKLVVLLCQLLLFDANELVKRFKLSLFLLNKVPYFGGLVL